MKKYPLIVLCLSICFLSACNEKKTSVIKVMSYNIKHGVGMDNILDLSRAADIVKSETPDFCGLQEVDNFCLRSDSVGQTDYLAQKAGMTGTFNKFMDFQGGQYGLSTLTAKPVVSSKLLRLPGGLQEPRSAIVQEVRIDKDCSIVLANIHLDWIVSAEGVASRLRQAKALMKYIDTTDKPVIIVGDFNCLPDSPTMKYFEEQGFEFIDKGKDNLSYQGANKADFDHVIYRATNDIAFKPKSIYLLEEPVASDHRPLVAEIEVNY